MEKEEFETFIAKMFIPLNCAAKRTDGNTLMKIICGKWTKLFRYKQYVFAKDNG